MYLFVYIHNSAGLHQSDITSSKEVYMKNTKVWASISLFNFCVVAVLGVVLRSKILFDLPWINYINLLDGHSHFAFGGWVTLALVMLLVRELLPESTRNKNIYQWILGSILLSSVAALFATILNMADFRGLSSGLFIVTSYVFGWSFIRNIRKAAVSKTIKLMSVSAILCLILSSFGQISLFYLHATGSTQPILYRDSVYIYLHFQYNGFFTLAVFALFFQRLPVKVQRDNDRKFYWCSWLLCLSIVPSLFLSFLWQDPSVAIRTVALVGSMFVFISVTWLIISLFPVIKLSKSLGAPWSAIALLCGSTFVLKMVLQTLTIFPVIGNAVFGDRPIIIGFLHLVFLGFVSPFILLYYIDQNILSMKVRLLKAAIVLFAAFVLCNEAALMLQGLGAMFLKSSHFFAWFLWATSIGLLMAIVLVFGCAMRSSRFEDTRKTEGEPLLTWN